MNLWSFAWIALGSLSWLAIGVALIYWINRAKHAETERDMLHEELQMAASLLAQYHNSHHGKAKAALGEIAIRLSAVCPYFDGFLKLQNGQKEE